MQWLACFDSALSAAEVGLERGGVDAEAGGASPAAPCGSCALWQLVEGLGSCDPPE